MFPLKIILPLACFFLVLQGIAETIRCVQCIKTGAWPKRLEDVEELETELIRKRDEERAAEAAQQDGDGKEDAI